MRKEYERDMFRRVCHDIGSTHGKTLEYGAQACNISSRKQRVLSGKCVYDLHLLRGLSFKGDGSILSGLEHGRVHTA